MNILDFADEEPWARQAFKYTTNFPTSDIFISCLSKDQTDHYNTWDDFVDASSCGGGEGV